MPQATRLFTVTSWLLSAAFLVCLGVLVVMFLVLGALLLDAMGVFQIPIPPAFTHDASVGTVLAVSAMVITAGAACMGLYALILMLIGRILRSATVDDPFVARNAMRLNAIGALLLVLQGVGLVTNLAIATLPHAINKHLHLGFGVSMSGLFAALLVFVLAQIFQRGSEMRAELEGTV
jgi:Protein of unknown function (DUF2975)